MDALGIGLKLLDTKGGSAFMGGVGSALGGLGGAPAGPSNAESAVYGSGLDSSGWSVNFAGVQNAASSQDKSGGVPGLGISGVSGSVPWYVWAGLAGVVVWKIIKKSK